MIEIKENSFRNEKETLQKIQQTMKDQFISLADEVLKNEVKDSDLQSLMLAVINSEEEIPDPKS